MTDRPFCECLAAWVDSEPCICDQPIGAPMEVSASKLAEANRLVGHIKEIDRALTSIAKGRKFCRTLIWYDSEYRAELQLPADIAQGLLRTMRFHTLVKLSETGVVSAWSGHRPVVAA
jgi:hypothetical protein